MVSNTTANLSLDYYTLQDGVYSCVVPSDGVTSISICNDSELDSDDTCPCHYFMKCTVITTDCTCPAHYDIFLIVTECDSHTTLSCDLGINDITSGSGSPVAVEEEEWVVCIVGSVAFAVLLVTILALVAVCIYRCMHS